MRGKKFEGLPYALLDIPENELGIEIGKSVTRSNRTPRQVYVEFARTGRDTLERRAREARGQAWLPAALIGASLDQLQQRLAIDRPTLLADP